MRIGACLLLLILGAGVMAQTPVDYDLDDNNLIDVTTADQLQAIAHDLSGAGNASAAAYGTAFPDAMQGMGCAATCTGYELLNDLDLTGRNWSPIGGVSESMRYNAILEGHGHVIRNLSISSGASNTGLFRALGADGIIRNVGLVDVDVSGSGIVLNTGALVGWNYGTVAASYAVGGSVQGFAHTGGLAGRNDGTIVAGYASVAVLSVSNSGGLVSRNSGGRIIASYAFGVNSGCNGCGGLVSVNEGRIEDSYYDRDRGSWGHGNNVPLSARQGGATLRGPTTAVGIYAAWDRLNVDDTTGTVMGVMTINDDAPWDFGNGFDYPVLRGASARYPGGNTTNIRVQRRLQQSFGFASLSRRGTGPIEEGATATYAVELSGVVDAATMSWSVELTGVGAGHAAASDFVGPTAGMAVLVNTASAAFEVGIARDQAAEPREAFRVRLSDLEGPFNLRLSAASSALVSFIRLPGGTDYDADDNRLIEVATTSQLAAIRHDLGGMGVRGVAQDGLAAYGEAFASFDGASCPGGCIGYELTDDLDLAGVHWEPIGGGGNPVAYYSAVFEGNGYIISNLDMDSPSLDNAGLFGALGRFGRIRNVGLRDVRVVVAGGAHTGALVGRNEGTVAACYVAGGRVEGVRGAGGLAGANVGTVIASYAAVAVHANGLRSGGLIGRAIAGSVVSASYAVGMVTGGSDGDGTIRGGLSGGRDETDAAVYDVQASYFDLERSGQASCCGDNAPSPDEAPRRSAELRIPTTAIGIYAGWDRLDVDGVDQGGDRNFNDDAPWDFGDGSDYPVLRGAGARYPGGNITNTRVQRRLQPPPSLSLRQRDRGPIAEGVAATYAVESDGLVTAATMTWSVELTGAGTGHAAVADFSDTSRADPPVATTGMATLINTASAIFQVRIASDQTPEQRETFRVRLSNLQGPEGLYLSAASSALVSVIASNGMDYDVDDDNLIDVATTSQLAAIRYDLGGAGALGVEDTDAPAYQAAFPFFDEFGSCPGGCAGYELSNDLDLSGAGDWTPLGGGVADRGRGDGEEYASTFEGHGFVISNMRIRPQSRLDNVGLFGVVGARGVIRNVGLTDVDMELPLDSAMVGALAGVNRGRIAASYVAGGMAQTGLGAGGLVGVNEGTLIACYANVAVHVRGASRCGGLVGLLDNAGVVSASYAIGRATAADGNRVGGLAGERAADGLIQRSYFDRERGSLSSCCGGGSAPSPDETPRTSIELRAPATAAGTLYAGWDQLNVDGADQGGNDDLNDDAPWDFGSGFEYPVLRGVSARFPAGNTTAIRIQRQLQPPPPSLSLSRRGTGPIEEGTTVTYAAELNGVVNAATMSWSVELTGVGTGHAEASDFVEPTSGRVVLMDTGSAVFQVRIAQDERPELGESFRVRLSDLEGPDGLRLSVASSAVVSVIAADGVDYDADNDNLIDVRTAAQLQAIEHDLSGVGNAAAAAYSAAFPDALQGMGCAAACTGYELLNDLDLSGRNWRPIAGRPHSRGFGVTIYSGDFDGRGHVITGLYINRPTSDRVGLFGHIGTNSSDESSIRNLGLLDVDITGADEVGALAGRISTNTVVTTIYAAGGSVAGDNVVGGLVGLLQDDLIAVYASVAVSGRDNVGGLAGAFGGVQSRNLSASYAAGSVAGSGNVGGLIGIHEENQGVDAASSYWDTLASGQSASALGVGTDTEALQTPTAYDGIYADWNVDVDGDGNADDPWHFGTSTQRPVLQYGALDVARQHAALPPPVVDYSSDNRLIDVRTVEQLHAIRWDLDTDGSPDRLAYATSYSAAFPDAAPNMGCAAACAGYALAGDVDLGASRFGRARGSGGWQPIGSEHSGYRGHFDGRGHVITGLYINRPTSDHVGLFAHIGRQAGALGDEREFQNLGLLGVDVTGNNRVGALAGRISTRTTVTTIYVADGSVAGNDEVGGLVGWLNESLHAVYASSVAVRGRNDVGGLVGLWGGNGQSNRINASYVAGGVTGTSNVGGLVGRVTVSLYAVDNSYWDTLASGQGASALGVGTDTAALQTPTAYDGIYADWNVDVDADGSADNPWNFGTSMQYPVLQYGGFDVARQHQVQQPSPVVFEAEDYPVGESSGSVAVALRLSTAALAFPASAFPITGTVTALDEASPQSRYDMSTSPVAFALHQGAARIEVRIPVVADAIPEEQERVSLQLLVHGYPDSTRTASATITDDDEIVVGFERASYAIDEGASLAVCVTMTAPAPAVPLEREFSLALESRPGTADTGDYTRLDESLGPFGHSTRSACFDVMTVEDEVIDLAETFQVVLAAPGALERVVVAPSLLTITINEDDLTMDYSSDDRLIDVRTPEQLHAMRWDLDGDGRPDRPAYATSYSAAFLRPANNMGCASTCAGYALLADVDLGASRFGRDRSSYGWPPIGDGSAGYGGDFDGRGYVISGLYIHRPSSDHVGLFARLGAGAGGATPSRVQNLGLINVDVTGSDQVGALAGHITNAVVTTIYAANGLIRGDGDVGGLAGWIEGGELVAVYAAVSVSGMDNVGGLGGRVSGGGDGGGSLAASYAAGRVSGAGGVGGLVGRRTDGYQSTAAASYWDTRISGQTTSALGVGVDTVSLQTPTTYDGIYAAWNVDVDGVAGGDDVWDFGTSTQYPVLQYAGADDVQRQRDALLRSQLQIALRVTGAATVAEGGVATYTVIASQAPSYPVAVSWEVGAGTGAVVATADDFRAAATALPLAAYPTGTATIRQGATATTFSVYVLADDVPEVAESYRVSVRVVDFGGRVLVASESSAVAATIEFGGVDYDVDGDGLIDVATTSQLAAIRYDLGGRGLAGVSAANESDYLAAFGFFDAARTCPAPDGCIGYELSNDLDLSSVNPDPGPGWTPIGGGGNSLSGRYYTAVFEGNGYVISNLRVVRSGRLSHTGLFGAVSASGTVRNVGLRDAHISVVDHSTYIGALVGRNEGTVAASYVQGSTVSGVWAVGGLTGGNFGRLVASYADVRVHAGDGGEGANAGGLTGEAGAASVVDASYSTGLTTGESQVGGLIGQRLLGAAVQSSYFDGERGGSSAPSDCCGTNVLNPDNTRKTSAALTTPTAATGIYAGWGRLNVNDADENNDGDFNDDAPWDFGASFQYPVLRHARTEAAVQAQHSGQPEVTLTPELAGDAVVSEGATASYVVSLDEVLSSAMTASWSWAVAGDAVDAGDFDGTTRGRVVIAPGRSSASFSLALAADGVAEFGEAFEVSLRDALFEGPANVRLGVPAGAVRTTIAGDGVRRVTLAASSATVAEGATATFTLILSAAGGEAVVVEYEIAAVGGLTPEDLVSVTAVDRGGTAGASVVALPVTGSVTLDADGGARVSVRTADDGVALEGGEGFRVRLTRCPNCREYVAAIGVPSSLTVVINDDDVMDYSGDGRLIDVRTPGQLHAMRWDLNGDGVADTQAYATSYSAAFPASTPNMGCDTTCAGYALARDVDLGASRFGRAGGGAGWSPIGAAGAGYGGDFDGREYVISGLYIHRPSSDHVGLFARLGAGATTQRRISNLGLINVDVTGNDQVGTLAGWVSTGAAVSKVYVSSGSVAGNEGVGGLAGTIGADVIAVYASVSVSGTRAVGGLAGVSDGGAGRRLVAGYAAGRVAGASEAGGLVGRDADGMGAVGTSASYWDTLFSGLATSALGVGTETASLQRPTTYGGIYAAWNVDVDGDGEADDPWRFGTPFDYPVLSGGSAHVARQFSLPPQFEIALVVTGAATVAEGGVATYTVIASRLLHQPLAVSWEVGAGTGAVVAAPDDFRAAATTTLPLSAYPTGTATIRQGATATTFSVYVLADGVPEAAESYRVSVRVGDFGGRVLVASESSAVVTTIEFEGRGYDADGNNLIDVATVDQLSAIRYDLGGRGLMGVSGMENRRQYQDAFPLFDESKTCPATCAGYELLNDLDLSSAGNWIPIGKGSDQGGNDAPVNSRYLRVFEGNGYVIRNMRITRTETVRYNHAGLFTALGAGGVIRAVGLENVSVDIPADGSLNTGALVGTNYGRIAASYVVGGEVQGYWVAGGLVGRMRGGIVIASYTNVGAGARGSAAGGLVGAMDAASIVAASYAIGRVYKIPSRREGGRFGGLVGERNANSVEIRASYFDRGDDRSGQSACCGHNPVSPDNTPRKSAALTTPTAAVGLYAAWDQLDVNRVDENNDGDFNDDAPWDFGASFQYPVLRHARTEAAVQAQYSSQPEEALTPELAGDAVVSEGATASYVVSLDAVLSSAMTASWSWAVDGGAADAGDFDGTTRGRVVIAPGRSSASFSLAVAADGVAEFGEAFEVSLRDALFEGPANVRLGVPAGAVRTTIAGDGVRRVTLAASSATVAEGATATFTLILSATGGEAAVVEYEIAAVGGLTPEDLVSVTVADRGGTTGASVVALPVTGSVTLDADGGARVSVRTADDGVALEGGEGFRVRLTRCPNCREYVAAIGVPSSLTVVVNDDDVMDYSGDGRLIDVRTPGQLHAMRWDLNGDGVADTQAYATSYSAAFPASTPNMGCDTTCAGYALARDVDLGASRFGRGGGGAGWSPIGAAGAGYGGDFDGREYVISGLYIHRPSSDHVGLFARLGAGATTQRRISNLGLINVDVTGNDQVGALAGWVSTGAAVSKVYVSSGSVAGNEGVGGLAGTIGADVIAVYASVSVSGTRAVGGLAGVSDGGAGRRLVAGYAAGRVAGASEAGGLVGRDADGMGAVGTSASYWDTLFSGLATSALGVGTETASLQRPTTYGGIYAAWDVDVDGDGVADDPWRFGTPFDYPVLSGGSAHVARQFSLPPQFEIALVVTGAATVAEGGVATYTVVASQLLPYSVAVSWEVGAGTGAVVVAPDDFRAGATTMLPLAAYPAGTATIRQGATATTFSVYALADGVPEVAESYRVVVRAGDFGGRVLVASESSAVVTTIEFEGRGYDADGNNLIDVATTAQLSAIRYDLGGRGLMGVSERNRRQYQAAFPLFDENKTCLNTCAGYELLNDLDLSSAGNWIPIGKGSDQGDDDAPANSRYRRVFEGNGYVIEKMRIVQSDHYNHAGLFTALGAGGVIRAVGLKDVNVDISNEGSVNTGALVGTSYGRIAASYVAGGAVQGYWAAGGLVGRMHDNAVVIASYTDVGAGARGSAAGGLVGSMHDSSIVNASYAIGRVYKIMSRNPGGRFGGLVGERNANSVEIRASYFDSGDDRSDQSACCGNNPVSPDNTPRELAALTTPTAAVGLYAAWDQLDVNGVDENADGDFNDDAPWDFGASFQYPVLRYARTEAAVRAQHSSQPEVTLTPELAGDAVVAEGGAASYAVSLEGALPSGATASWNWAVDDGVVGAGDFDGSTNGSVVIAPGRSSASFSLAVAVDGVAEVDEVYAVSLGDALFEGPANVRLGVPMSAQTTIAANELGQVTLVAESETVAEGATATFTLRLDGGGDGDVTVEFQLIAVSETVTPADLGRMTWIDREGADGRQASAFTGEDSSGTVVLRTADIATVTVVAAADGVPGESAERFGVRLTRCEDCGRVHPVEIGVPSSAQVTISRTPLTVSAQVYLEGAYSAETSDMKTTLAGRLPRRQPYGVAPWNYPAPTAVPVDREYDLRQVTSTIVDWVLVELRASAPDAGAGAALPVAGGVAAGLLLRDGRVAGINEAAPAPSAALSLDGVRVEAEFAQGSDIYVLVHHRNHLSVMSAQPAAFAAAGCGGYCVDFRNAQSHGACAQVRGADGVYRMAAGDVNRSGVVSWGDDAFFLQYRGTATYGRQGSNYLVDGDLNFDGRVSLEDAMILLPNHLLSSEQCAPRP